MNSANGNNATPCGAYGYQATTARALFLSEHTVRNYVKRSYCKLGVHSLGELRERIGSITSAIL